MEPVNLHAAPIDVTFNKSFALSRLGAECIRGESKPRVSRAEPVDFISSSVTFASLVSYYRTNGVLGI